MMMTLHKRHGVLVLVVSLLLIHAMTLRAAIPAGLMLGTDAETGSFGFVICSPSRAGVAIYDPATGEVRDAAAEPAGPGQDSVNTADTCPFALSAVAALPVASSFGLSAPAVLPPVFLLPSSPVAPGALARAPLPPRGPPATV